MDHGLPLVWNVIGCCPFERPFCNILSQTDNRLPHPELLVSHSEHVVSRPFHVLTSLAFCQKLVHFLSK